jgi:hypothetical protein
MIQMGYVAHMPLTVLASGGLSSTLAVGLAGFVVVLTVVLVFVMLLRSNGAGKRTASGIGYDAQQGPLGQPQDQNAAWPAPRGGNAPGWPQTESYDYGNPPQGPAGGRGAGWEPNFGGQQGAAGPASQGGWNNAPSQGGWNDQRSYAGAGAGGSQWGEPAAQGGWGNQGGGWDAQPGPGSRPAAGAGAAAGWSGANQMAGQGGWGDQGGPGAAAAWGGAPAAAPQSAGWGNQPAPQSAGWGGAAPQGTPGWNGNAPQGAPGYDNPYGDADKTRVVRPNAGQQRTSVIVVRQGKEPGRIFELRKERLTIGRSRESDIFLEDLAVSRLHTTINNDGNGHYIIRDEGSANGTYVNQQRITEQVLEEGDEIQVGQTVLAFVRR